MPDFRQFWEAFMAAAPRAAKPAPAEGCTATLFLRLHPFEFHGNEGAIAADDWLTSYEELAKTVKCTDDQKVEYASLVFHSEAQQWWKSKKLYLVTEYGQGVPIRWECFKQEFNDRFFPLTQRQRSTKDFLELKQGSMSVEQYSAEFMRLSRYAPYLIPDEGIKVEKFRGGLVPRILEWVIFVKVADYSEMVHVATMAEIRIKTATVDYMSRKRPMFARTSSTPPFKKQATSSSVGSQGRKSIYAVRLVVTFRDATSAGSHIWESACMGQVYVTSVASLATLLENAPKQVEAEGLQFQPGFMLSPRRTS